MRTDFNKQMVGKKLVKLPTKKREIFTKYIDDCHKKTKDFHKTLIAHGKNQVDLLKIMNKMNGIIPKTFGKALIKEVILGKK